MARFAHVFLAASFLVVNPFASVTRVVAGDSWHVWRGRDGNNHAAATANVPESWNLATGENVRWKTEIPGRGHSTPIVVDNAIFLTTAELESETQSLVKFDRASGKRLDQWVVHRGGLPANIHSNNSHASPTPAFDGEHIIVTFHTSDAIVATAMTTDGEQVWQTRVSSFRPNQFEFGYGASPLVVDDHVMIAAEYDGAESGLYALDRKTGKEVWKTRRPVNLNFATPIAIEIHGRTSVVLAGADLVAGYDPVTGKEQWSVSASTEAMCGTAVWKDNRIIVSGGNPQSGTWCISPDAANVVWQNRVMCYEQSPIVVGDFVYAVADNGVAYCWQIDDGKEMWRNRLFAGRISASPLLVQGQLMIAAEDGMMFVVPANPNRFDVLHENPTGDSIFASPVAVDDVLLVRTGVREAGTRQEYLVAIGKPQ